MLHLKCSCALHPHYLCTFRVKQGEQLPFFFFDLTTLAVICSFNQTVWLLSDRKVGAPLYFFMDLATASPLKISQIEWFLPWSLLECLYFLSSIYHFPGLEASMSLWSLSCPCPMFMPWIFTTTWNCAKNPPPRSDVSPAVAHLQFHGSHCYHLSLGLNCISPEFCKNFVTGLRNLPLFWF